VGVQEIPSWKHNKSYIIEKLRAQRIKNAEEREKLEFQLKVMAHQKC